MTSQPATSTALLRLRELSGLSRRVAARQIGVDKRTLLAWEEGRVTPDSEQVSRATRVYGRDLDWFLGNREPITNPDEPGLIRVGEQVVDTNRIRFDNPGIHEANKVILVNYVDAVRVSRGIPVAGIVELRALDVGLLARELDVSDPELTQLLADVFKMTPAGALSATRAVLVGSLMALATVGILAAPWFSPNASATETTRAHPAAHQLFSTQSFASPHGPAPETPVDTPSGDLSTVFSVNPRDVSQQRVPGAGIFSPEMGQGLHALPAGSPELPEK